MNAGERRATQVSLVKTPTTLVNSFFLLVFVSNIFCKALCDQSGSNGYNCCTYRLVASAVRGSYNNNNNDSRSSSTDYCLLSTVLLTPLLAFFGIKSTEASWSPHEDLAGCLLH